MTNTTIKTVLFAGLVAALLIPFIGQQEAEAAIAAPIFEGAPGQGITVTWGGTVAHAAGQVEYGTQTNWCGQSFTASGFYDTTYNKRGASHYVPNQINQICNIDNDASGYFNVTLDKVEYSFYGDGNTSIVRYDMGSGYANYKFFNDAISNSGYEYVIVKATYVHTS
jgi:hypothetical protein